MLQKTSHLPIGSSLPAMSSRKVSTRVASMLELPRVCTSTTSINLRNEGGIPSAHSYTSSDTASSTEFTLSCNFLPEPPRCDRSNCQPSFRQTRFGACPSSLPATGETELVQYVNDSIMKEVPNALVTYVHDGTSPEVSSVIPISCSHDFGKAFRNSSHSFILVHSYAQCATLTIEMLRKHAGESDGAVIIVLIQQDATADFHPIVEKVPAFVDSGADDVMVIPLGASNINYSISVSLAKAKASRDQRIYLKRQIRASMNQCQRLFWKDVHDFIPGFPEMQPQLHEVRDSRVGNMVFVRKLGKGGYGTVYKCVNEINNRCSAVKVIAKDRVYSASHALQIATEIGLLQKLQHENIITFHGVAHSLHCVYLFLELAGPMNLFQMIHAEDTKGLPWSCAGWFFSQIASGVAHCHKMLVAHCDLKPKNVVVSELGSAKIVDFGLAVDFSKDVVPLQGPFGTMPFTAPEIMCCCPHWDPPAADMWSLGVIVVEMLCGNGAFVDLLGWRSLGRELRNPLKKAKRANELKAFFAKDETDAHGNAMMAISGLCHELPSPLLMELLGKMLEVTLEGRILAVSAAERIDYISTLNPSEKRS